MKKVIETVCLAALLSACGGIGESGTKITGTLSGEDATGFSEIQVFLNGTPLLETPAIVSAGQFTLRLPSVPAELTTPWLNGDNTEHVRIAEAEIVADNQVAINPHGSETTYGKNIMGYDASWTTTGIYRYIYADRDADMKGWSNNADSRFFNWVIADWLEQSEVPVEWSGRLKKGWNTVRFTCKRERIGWSGEKRSGTATVQPVPEEFVWKTANAVALKAPPTGRFSGQISGVTKRQKQIYMGYNQFYYYNDPGELIPTDNGKFQLTLPEPPPAEMRGFSGLIRLFHEHGVNTTTALSFDVSAGKIHIVKLADIGFFEYGDFQFLRLTPYYGNTKVVFVYSDGDLIVTGDHYYQSGSGHNEFNLHFKKGWNTVLCPDSTHRAFETAEINGEIEFR